MAFAGIPCYEFWMIFESQTECPINLFIFTQTIPLIMFICLNIINGIV